MTDSTAVMDFYRLQYDLDNHPSIKLLRLKHAPLIVSFLHRQFKQAHRITISQNELVEKLEDTIEFRHETEPGLFPRPAQEYLDQWCNEHKFLRKYYADNDEPVFELTPAAEKAIGWLAELHRSEFVGTESRFLRIFEMLEEMATRSSEDVTDRLAYLEAQKAAIEQEIETIRRTGRVERFSARELRERFLEANESTRRLLADFREVEQNFRDLTRQVQEQQLRSEMHKGAVVEQLLDADEQLRQSDQGRSFYAFWQFLTQPQRQDALQTYLDIIYHLPDIQSLDIDQQQTLRRLKHSLLEAGDKIIQSNQRLAEQLRRMLDEQYVTENRRVAELITGIKRLALAQVTEPPADRAFITLEDAPEVQLPLERPLWAPSQTPTFDNDDLAVGAPDLSLADLTGLYSTAYVDETRLRRQIAALLTRQPAITLGQLTRRYPIEQGLPEVITYFLIASSSGHHTIDEESTEQVLLSHTNGSGAASAQTKLLTLPQIIFRR